MSMNLSKEADGSELLYVGFNQDYGEAQGQAPTRRAACVCVCVLIACVC